MLNFKQTILRAMLVVLLGICFSVAAPIGIVKNAILSPVPTAQTATRPYEVFGFAPYWTIDKLDNVDYSVLSTLAYFGVPVNSDGTLDTTNIGYTTLMSEKADEVFKEAHSHGTRVVLTVTQMNNDDIEGLLNSMDAQKSSIDNIISLVKKENMDGVNVDFEYVGDPGQDYRNKFTSYIENLTTRLHRVIPGSKLTVSVYASAIKDPKIYDIGAVSKHADAIFMMAYDFATSSSDTVIPTDPLYGYKEGKYWYDISTAVSDFLTVMPSNKLILGLPWYGYNYPVTQPGVKVAKYQGYSYYYWYRGRRYIGYSAAPESSAITYATATQDVQTEKTGWDDTGKVGWRAYQADGVWHMMFLDDARSLKIKYDFAKDQKLAGVGVWALGFDAGSNDMWRLLSQEFGETLAYNTNN